MTNLATITLSLLAVFGGGGGDDDAPKGNPIEVRIRTGALARGVDVKIGELCEITPITADTMRLAELVFAPSPSSGRARTITRTEIMQSLAAAGNDISLFTFAGPNEIVVQPIQAEIPSAELLEVATAALQAMLSVEGGDVEVETPGRLRRYASPPGRRSRELDARVRTGRTGPSSAVVDVAVIIDGQKHTTIPITFKLQRFHMLLKTRGPIKAGTRLGPQNITVSREPLAQATGLYMTDMNNVVGQEASRNLQSNSRITLGDVAPPAVVRRGEVVTVVLTKGRVKITARAMATHAAPLGGRVTLTNMRSRASLTGIVAAPGLVVIQH